VLGPTPAGQHAVLPSKALEQPPAEQKWTSAEPIARVSACVEAGLHVIDSLRLSQKSCLGRGQNSCLRDRVCGTAQAADAHIRHDVATLDHLVVIRGDESNVLGGWLAGWAAAAVPESSERDRVSDRVSKAKTRQIHHARVRARARRVSWETPTRTQGATVSRAFVGCRGCCRVAVGAWVRCCPSSLCFLRHTQTDARQRGTHDMKASYFLLVAQEHTGQALTSLPTPCLSHPPSFTRADLGFSRLPRMLYRRTFLVAI
jgi:hypothetical protein